MTALRKPLRVKSLDALNDAGVKATFFFLGKQASDLPHLVRRAADEGHTIGTHTQNHARLPESQYTDEIRRQEIDRGIESVSAALGSERRLAPFFRFPVLKTPKQAGWKIRETFAVDPGKLPRTRLLSIDIALSADGRESEGTNHQRTRSL
jgi:peptidoglycan/xylan/chitin deacetylase (PgdA/CDA1 family)